jgi:hypothetical protein
MRRVLEILGDALFVILIAAVLLALFGNVASCADRDEVEVTISPRVALTGTVRRLNVRIAEPEELRCPRIEVQWPDGTRSTRESDCEPGGEADIVSESWRFFPPEGEVEIRVEVTRGARRIIKRAVAITR